MNLYPVFLAAGACLGLWQLARALPSKEISRWLDFGLWTLFGAFIGARLVYVGAAWSYFRLNTEQILRFWDGGLSWPGAFAGGLLAILLISAARKIPLAAAADRLSSLVLPVTVTGWLGAWQAGAAYGPLAPGRWWAVPAASEDGLVALRFPLQALAVLVLLAAFTWMERRLKDPARPGQRFSLILLLVFADLLIFSFWRADPSPLWSGLRPDTWAAMAGCLIFGASTVLLSFSSRSRQTVIHQ